MSRPIGLNTWVKKYGTDSTKHNELTDAQSEIKRLQKELERGIEEQDFKKPLLIQMVEATVGLSGGQMLDVHPSGYYAGNHKPH